MCLLIPLMVEYKVAKVQEVAVILYDYYEPRESLCQFISSLFMYLLTKMNISTKKSSIYNYLQSIAWIENKMYAKWRIAKQGFFHCFNFLSCRAKD